ncbi:MAG: methylated-DNA--[protein]-cysteine S-methyltransferase [Coriobacteriia bacterium]
MQPEIVRYALVDSSLGRLLVATTDCGVCLTAFGESDAELAAEATRRFPRGTIELAEGGPPDWVEAVVELIDAPAGPDASAAARLPLDMRGTDFQRQVWAALREIPRGRTVTYSQLAATIGRPTATRAVASACGANPLAVIVPCHRVIGADGSLRGYRWGLQRKQILLDREGASHG